ncbi:hypothetical protein OV207_24195 [Corallococcus sp. BB11-1]|uniref:hypothetical protein n=1 Tax=Corallococcus sp. BB11-1 TaxID=2996783 RepID=UPI00226DE9B7|nr:hypothetical protein [Corallococcus sp. BB11-1]MCY1034575.1 hypothetical protein [Corallococcus sp. BB11-1]
MHRSVAAWVAGLCVFVGGNVHAQDARTPVASDAEASDAEALGSEGADGSEGSGGLEGAGGEGMPGAAGTPVPDAALPQGPMADPTEDDLGAAYEEPPVEDTFQYRVRLVATGRLLGLSDGPQNPQNLFLRIPDRSGTVEGRPEFELNMGRWAFSFRPRFQLNLAAWPDGVPGGDEIDNNEFILQWYARWSLTDSLFASFGKENLQWGPSQFFSPSNPFFLENFRADPITEGRGSYFARVTWVPDIRWTVSALANLFEEEVTNPTRVFERQYALKADYQGDRIQGSLIGAYGERSRMQLGGYGIWTANDAWLIYGEGKVAARNAALYPVVDGASPFGASMAVLPKDDQANATVLVGSSYTLQMNVTVTAELLHNSSGYSSAQQDLYFALRRSASGALFSQGPEAGFAAQVLGQTASPGLRFTGRNYGVLQGRYGWGDDGEVLLRWSHGLDDSSGSLVGMTSFPLGDHVSAVALGVYNYGSTDSESASVLRYTGLAGLEYTF